jgi:Fibronectin type III domain
LSDVICFLVFVLEHPGYKLSFGQKGVLASQRTVSLDPTVYNYTVTGLTPSTTYTVELKAETRAGSGPSLFADIKSGVTPGKLKASACTAVTSHKQTAVLQLHLYKRVT